MTLAEQLCHKYGMCSPDTDAVWPEAYSALDDMRQLTIEECAKVAESLSRSTDIATAIRALAQKERE